MTWTQVPCAVRCDNVEKETHVVGGHFDLMEWHKLRIVTKNFSGRVAKEAIWMSQETILVLWEWIRISHFYMLMSPANLQMSYVEY